MNKNKKVIYTLLIVLIGVAACSKGADDQELPEAIQKKLYQANVAYLKKEFDTALDTTKIIAVKYPNLSRNLLLQGKIFFFTKRFKESLEVFNEILKEQPNHQEALIWMAQLYALKNETLDMSEKYLKKAINNNPSNHRLYYLLGNVYRRKGDIKNSLRHFKQTLRVELELLNIYADYEKLLKKAGLKERADRIRKKKVELTKIIK